MKKTLIHCEFNCILSLVSLPFLLLFYQEENMVFWLLIAFLDIASIMLLYDENKLINYLIDKELKQETRRIKIYLVAGMCFYIYFLFAHSYLLFVILIANDIIMSGINYLLYKYIIKEQS